VALRKRHKIQADAALDIQAAERDIYVAKINDRCTDLLDPCTNWQRAR
jgi:hypothetical protein